MRENHILRPELIGLVGPLRELLGGLLQPRRTAEVQMTVVDQGVDVSLKGVEPDGLAAMETLTAFCESQRLARLSMDQGFGAETIYEPNRPRSACPAFPSPFRSAAFFRRPSTGRRR